MRRARWLALAWAPLLLMAAFSAGDETLKDAAVDNRLAAVGDNLTLPNGTLPFRFDMVQIESVVGAGEFVLGRPEMVAPFTGPVSPSRTLERWNISGADLGFTFEHDDEIHMVFGDTWGRTGTEGDDWRSNTMVIVEPDATHGYLMTDVVGDENGDAKELLPSLKQAKREYTVIPTAGISVDGRMYLHYLSVNDWNQHWWGYKEPVPNGSGFAYSDDDGQTWIKDETAVWPGNTPFAQAAMVQLGDYVYVFGTPAGRFGAAQLFRVESGQLLEPDEYEYWTGGDWSADPLLATEVVPFPVGELSVKWSAHHQLWLMMYTNEITHASVLRTAEKLTGPWSPEEVVIAAHEYPTHYAPSMLPITGPEIYFTLSIFAPDYQVYLMRVTLDSGVIAE